MANSGENLSVLFRSLGPDDESFHMAENELAKKSEQKWPLFKAISLKRPEPTPELSAQERQCWNRREKSAVEERKPALSLPAFSKKLTISLDKITKQVELGAVQPSFNREQASMQNASPVGHFDEQQQLESNIVDTPNFTSTFSTSILSTSAPITPAPQFFKPSVADLNLDAEPSSHEHTDVMPVVPMRELSDTNHADDSLQSLFSRIQGKEKVTNKSAEKQSLFFDRLRKR
jgi:hypothetical protein